MSVKKRSLVEWHFQHKQAICAIDRSTKYVAQGRGQDKHTIKQ